jgi:three-Cys-motif partner protein
VTKTPAYLQASDGLPARVSGAWAKDKLYYVERYFTIFNKGMYRKWPRRAYVDLMAGPGRCITANGAEEFDGSPILAATSAPEFEQCVFVEADPDLGQALATRTAQHGHRVSILPGDCNDPAVVERIRQAVKGAALSVVFVDMLGLDVWFSTLQALTAGRKMDLLITLQVNDLTRNAMSASTEAQDPDRFDRFFGASGWREAVKDCTARRKPAQDVAAALTEYYIERLGTIG